MGFVNILKQHVNGTSLATVVLLAGQVTAALGAVLVNVLAARVLAPDDRGDLAFALQIAYFLTVFAVMGLERPYIAERDEGFHSAYLNFVKLVLPGAIAIVPTVFVAVYYSHLGSDWIIYGIAAIAIYTALNAVSHGIRVGYVVSRDWAIFGIYTFMVQLLIIGGVILLTVLQVDQPEAWMLVYASSTLPALFLLAQAVRRRRRTRSVKREQRRRIRKKGWVLLPAQFSNTAMTRLDRLFLPIIGSPADLGLYVTVASVLEMAGWPVTQWVDASLRGWAKSGANLVAEIPKIMLKSFALLVLLAATLGVASYLMIQLFLPDSYQKATIVILPLAIGAVIFGLTRIQQGFLIAVGAAANVSVVEIIGTVTSAFSFLFFIPAYGMLGAAFGTIVGYIVCFILGAILLLQIRKKVGK